MDQASKHLDSAQSAQTTAQSNYNSASATTANAQATVNSASSAVDDAQANLNNVNTITLPAGYVQDLEAYQNGTLNLSEMDKYSYNGSSDGYVLNTYKDNEAAKKEIVDTTNGEVHLTDAQAQELSTFTAGLINQIRDQFGTQHVIVSDGSLDLSKDVIDGYNAMSDQPSWHNLQMTLKVNNYYGTIGDEVGDMNWGAYQISNLTMNDLYSSIYNGFTGWLFTDGGGNAEGHAISITGLKYKDGKYNTVQQYVGVGFDKWGDTWVDLPLTTSLAGKNGNPSDGKFNTTTTYADTPNVTALETALATAKAKLNTAKANLTSAQNAQTQAQQALDTANNNLTTAQSNQDQATQALTTAKADQTKAQTAVDQAQTDYNTAKANLENTKTAVTNAQAVVDSLNSDQQTKLANLQKAQDTLAAAQDQLAKNQKVLDSAKAALDQVNTTLANAKQATTNAQHASDQAKQQLATDQTKAQQTQTDLQTAKDNYAKAQVALKDAQATLANKEAQNQQLIANLNSAKDELTKQENELATRQAAAKAAQATLNQAKEALTKAQDALTSVQDALKNAQTKLANLENAPELLKQAQSAYDQAKADFDEAQAAYDEAKNQDDEAQVALTTAKEALTKAQNQLATLKALAKVENQAKANNDHYMIKDDQVIDGNGEPVEGWTVKDGQAYDQYDNPINVAKDESQATAGTKPTTGNGSTNNGQATSTTGSTVTATTKANLTEASNATSSYPTRKEVRQQAQKQGQLPQTGNESGTILSMVGVILASLLGFVGIDRKQKRQY